MQAMKRLTLTHKAPDGTIISDEEIEPNSFTVAWGAIMAAHMSINSTQPAVDDTDGNSRQTETSGSSYNMASNSGAPGLGTAFGTGTASFNHLDNDLASALTTNVSYGQAAISFNSTSQQSTVEIARSMSNTGSSTISISEAGLIAEADTANSGVADFLIARDVDGVSVDLAPNETLQGTYTVSYS